MPDQPTHDELVQRIRELEQQSGMLRALANAPFEAVFLSENGVCIDQNQAAERMFGYTREEAIGHPGTRWIDPRYREKVMSNMLAGLEEPYEVVALRKDGGTFPCEIQARGFVSGGRSIRVTALRDITARKEAGQLLSDDLVRLRILIDQSRDGIVIVDQEGGVFEANLRFAAMLGYTLEQVRELYVWDWDREYTKEQLLEMVRTVDEKGSIFETRHRRKDGSFIDVELSNNGAVFRGQKLVFCVCRDITERNRQAREREELIAGLQDALAEIRTLRGILPICASCKKIRDDQGSWNQIETYVRDHSEAEFSHGICPECAQRLYPEFGVSGE